MPATRHHHPGRRMLIVSILLAITAQHLLLITAVAASRSASATLTLIWLAAIVIGAAVWTTAVALVRIGRHQRHQQTRLTLALTDPVTGLPVRRVAEDAIANTSPDITLTVALADVDRLHAINHGPGGHAAGDRYLAETGRRLKQAAADGDIVARLGGDEFVLISRRTERQVADSLIAAFAAPTPVAGANRPVEVSVGISRLPGGDPHQLLGCASLAMFTAKSGGSRIEVYDPVRDGLPLPRGVRPAVRLRDRRRNRLDSRGTGRVLSFDEAEAAGFDGTGRDGDPRFPYTSDDLPTTSTMDDAADVIVDYFDLYRTEPDIVFIIDAIRGDQPLLTVGIATVGGGTVGRAYADNDWIYAVHLGGALVASGIALRSGRVARTHRQMAAVLAAALADGDDLPAALTGQAERLSVWAAEYEDGDDGR